MSVPNPAADKATTNADSQPEATPTAPAATDPQSEPARIDMRGAAIPVVDESAAPAPAEGDQSENPPEPEAGEPVEYEFTIPDGFEAHEEAINDFKTMASEMKLPQEQAQKLMDKYHELRRAEFEQQQTRLNEAMAKEWGNQYKTIASDPEFGGEKFDASRGAVAFALHKFGGQRTEDGKYPLAEALKDCGMANHPELFRFFARVGNYCREAGPAVSDSREAAKQKSPADVLFGDYKTQ